MTSQEIQDVGRAHDPEKRIGIGITNPLWTVSFGDASGHTVGHLYGSLEGKITFDGDPDASALQFAETMNALVESRRNRGVTLRLSNEPCDPAKILWRTYLRLPLIIEAVQIAEVFDVVDSEGIHQGSPGDFLVRDTKGQLHVIKPEAFKDSHSRWYYYPEPYNSLWRSISGQGTCLQVIAEHPELRDTLAHATNILEIVSKRLKEASKEE